MRNEEKIKIRIEWKAISCQFRCRWIPKWQYVGDDIIAIRSSDESCSDLGQF